MRFGKLKAAGIAAGVALFSFLSGPASAGSTSTTDGNGIDYDPSCLVGTNLTPPAANWNTGSGCSGVTTADGAHCALDLSALALASISPGSIQASWTLSAGASCTIAAAGSTVRAGVDLSDSNFVGVNYFALFQNKTIQTLAKYTACPQIPPRPTPIVQRFDTWKDGAHFFLAFSVAWDGTKWIHSAQLGEYSPDGGFGFFELGTNSGSGWVSANPHHPYGTDWSVSISGGTITVTAPGVYKSPDTTNCANGHFDYWFAKPGDVIANAKALTTANQVVTLPATVPLSVTCGATGGVVCESDLTTVGGFVYWADTTDGNSTAGLANSNITGIALTGGAIGGQDTLGDGPTCPTPTFGGLLPENPLWTVDTACQIDDDSVSRGSFLQEFWDTTHGFVF